MQAEPLLPSSRNQLAAHSTSSASNPKRSAPISRASAAYPRKRAVTACQVCRSRKTKCDQKKPACSFCETIGAECNSDTGSLSSFDPASIEIIQRLETLQRKLDSISYLTPAPASPEGTNPRAPAPVSAPHDRPLGDFLPVTLVSILKWPVFQHLSLPPVPTPSQCSPASDCSSTQWASVSITDELQPAACNRWLDAFFRHDHCKNPILDEQKTRHLARRVCEEGVGWDAESCLVLLVCANGVLARPLSPPAPTIAHEVLLLSKSLFAAALKRIGPSLGTAGVVHAQCFFFAGVFLMSTLQPFDAWRMFLQSLAICQSFSSHVQTDTLNDNGAMSGVEAEESIYWSSWKSEREVRWELGLPDFGDMGLDTPRTFPSCSKTHDGDNLRAWYFYLSEISLWRQETAAKKEMKIHISQNPSQLFESLAGLAGEKVQQISAWQVSLPPSLSITEDDLTSGEDVDVLKFVLRGRITYFHEMISWPFIYAAVNDGTDSSLIRSWAARGFAFHLERLKINQPGFYHRHHGTWLMLQSSARSACILLLGAQVLFTSELLPPGWQGVVEATIPMLRFWSAQSEGLGAVVDVLSLLLSEICNAPT